MEFIRQQLCGYFLLLLRACKHLSVYDYDYDLFYNQEVEKKPFNSHTNRYRYYNRHF